jgi:hypothetical protein
MQLLKPVLELIRIPKPRHSFDRTSCKGGTQCLSSCPTPYQTSIIAFVTPKLASRTLRRRTRNMR